MVEGREKEWKEQKEPDVWGCMDDFIEQHKEKEKAENQEYLDYLAKAYPTYELNREICGKTKDGREVVGLLGEGGNARVYACIETKPKSFLDEGYQDKNHRAVKIIKLDEKHTIERIQREFKTQYKYKDISVEIMLTDERDRDEIKKFYGVSMEMMDGTLRDLLKKEGSFDAVDTVRIMKKISSLVKKLHHGGAVHYDLKPENIFYKQLESGKTTFKLGDYGCTYEENATVTTLGGTDYYCLDYQETGPSRDMYAIGVILMELQGAEYDNENRWNPEKRWEKAEVDQDLRTISRKICRLKDDQAYSIDGFIESLDFWLASHEDEVAIKDGAMDVLLEKAEKLELESSTGIGDPISLMARALKFYKAASEKKSGKAAYRLYKIFDRDEKTYSKEKVMEQLEYSKNLNYAPALNEYACRRIQELGADGDPVELMQMIEVLRRAADGSPAAAYNLAVLMKADLAPETSEKEAENFLAKAAAQNFEAAIQLQKHLAE